MENTKKIMTVPFQSLRQDLWGLYVKSFANTDDFCAQDQICYDAKTMDEALLDPDYHKFILFDDDSVSGLCLITNNLAKARIAYCNDRFLRQKYPEYTSAGRFFYVTCICIDPQKQKRGLGLTLLEKICQFINDEKAMVGYDYSANKNPGLTALIQFCGSKMGWEVIELPLDAQYYTSLYYAHNGMPA